MVTVLIADDSRFLRNYLTNLLTQHGYEILLASDGMEAVETYQSTKPDIVLMDVTMPRMSGLHALEEICKFDPEARIIVLTALDQRSVAARAIQKGAKDFLVKPVIIRELLAALQKVLE